MSFLTLDQLYGEYPGQELPRDELNTDYVRGMLEAGQVNEYWEKVLTRLKDGREIDPNELGSVVVASELVGIGADGVRRYDANIIHPDGAPGSQFNEGFFSTLRTAGLERPTSSKGFSLLLSTGVVEFGPGVVPRRFRSRLATNDAYLTSDDVFAGYDAMFLYPEFCSSTTGDFTSMNLRV